MKMKRCCECRQEKPRPEFHKSKRHGGLAPRCKVCAIAVASRWYQENKDRKRAYDAKRRREKRDLYRNASKRWRENNPESKRADTNSRRRSLRNQMPPWTSPKDMRCFYEQAQRVSACLGSQFHVDHIIPIKGRGVRGLHVPWNLQVIPAIRNQIKSNHYSRRYGGIA
jgi:hypothetical protein